jgi:hypothetical protein
MRRSPRFDAFWERNGSIAMPNGIFRFTRGWQLIQASCDLLLTGSALSSLLDFDSPRIFFARSCYGCPANVRSEA